MTLQHQFVNLNNARIHYVKAGESAEDQPILIFLHGFPEYWQSWQQQLTYFAENYQVIAPDLPGYNLSEKLGHIDEYQIPKLIDTLREFIEVVSQNKPVFLIAHDWGGAIAWPLCVFHGQLFKGLVILNAAHPSTFTREMINNPEQRKRSDYINTLIGENAEEALQKDNFSFLRQVLFEQRLDSGFSKQQQQAYLRAWRQPGAISGMLNYYRAMPQFVGANNARNAQQVSDATVMKIPDIRVTIPTLVLWGERDKAFVPEVLSGLEHYVSQLHVVRFSDASHWLQHEKPTDVNLKIAEFIHTSIK